MFGRREKFRSMLAILGAAVLAVGIATAPSAAGQASPAAALYHELYRPQFHFTPAQNWMNDPNGLVYYKGEYHLFYQYNPSGIAVGPHVLGARGQPDLVHWTRAAGGDSARTATSWCSAAPSVIDKTTRAGSARRRTRRWWRSTPRRSDRAPGTGAGLQHRRRPDLDASTPATRCSTSARASSATRRCSGTRRARVGDGRRHAAEHKIAIYTLAEPQGLDASERLRAGQRDRRRVGVPATCSRSRSTGSASKTKWVMIVNLNPGGIAGGSGGAVLRRRLRRHDASPPTTDQPYTPPAGDVFADFEGADYGAWTTTGTAFGSGPAHRHAARAADGVRLRGNGLVNSFLERRRLAPAR